MNTGNHKDRNADTANSIADDAPTIPAVELPPLDGDLPPMTHREERAIMEALLDEASEGWEEMFGTKSGFPEASQEDDPKKAP